jgi:hypothetical protein
MTAEQAQRFNRYADIRHVTDRPFVSEDLIRFCLGDKISEGAYRAVYEFDLIPNTVIKISLGGTPNIVEFEVWEQLKDTPYAKWLAPCLHISPTGHFLIQRKCKPVPPDYKLPKKLPEFFTDLKRENWGLLNGKLVCVDYQFIMRSLDVAFNASSTRQWHGE